MTGKARRGVALLARDTAGNTLAMMAAAMIPVTAIAGSAVDTARLYVVKVRLQQACDAGVLAGRKFMASSNDAALDTAATKQANNFFNNNFRSNWMQAKAVSFTPSKTADQQVAGTATATVAMTVMKMFAAPDVKLNVVCEARYDVADTDVIFVLDTTGSMACLPSDSDTTCSNYVNQKVKDDQITSYTRPSSGNTDTVGGYAGSTGYSVPEKDGSRIEALRDAVLKFYDTVKANADSSTHVRYGFVTYSSTVNAGGAVMARSSAYMVGGSGSGINNWTYQSRRKTGEYIRDIDLAETSYNQTQCGQQATVRTPAATNSDSYPFDASSGTATRVSYTWTTYRKNRQNVTGCLKQTDTLGPQWTFQPISYDVRNYVAGNSITDPTKVTNATARWLGCIEERDTTAGATSFTTTSLPNDLNPDLIPAASGSATRWRPMLPEVVYGRNGYGDTADEVANDDNTSSNPWLFATSRQKAGFTACGKPVRRLAEMTRSQVEAYVNAVDFAPLGGTYHDVGMIWGTRMISPNGIFAADTAAWPGRNTPNRVIVFLTDGDMSPSTQSYGLYGLEYFDRRVTGGSYGSQKDMHNARFLAECQKAAALNIDVWTVAIGLATTTELKACATVEAQALDTTKSDLKTAFQKIATQVAMLRVSK